MSFPRRRESSFLSDLSYTSYLSEWSDIFPLFSLPPNVHPPCCVAGLPAFFVVGGCRGSFRIPRRIFLFFLLTCPLFTCSNVG